MPWFKVDDRLHSHPKWRATPLPARALWVTAGSWCADQLTDGFVPRHMLRALEGTPSLARQLVEAGLWEEAPKGWRFHQWDCDGDGTTRNPTRAEVERDRAAARDRQQRARDKSRESQRDKRTNRHGNSDRESQRDTTVSHTPPDPVHSLLTFSEREEAHLQDAPQTAPPPPESETLTSQIAARITTPPDRLEPDEINTLVAELITRYGTDSVHDWLAQLNPQARWRWPRDLRLELSVWAATTTAPPAPPDPTSGQQAASRQAADRATQRAAEAPGIDVGRNLNGISQARRASRRRSVEDVSGE